MADSIEPTGSGEKPYRPEYQDTPAFHKMWSELFRHDITDEESAKMTDGYMKIVNDFMNRLAQKSIQKLKEMRRMIESDYQDGAP